MSEYLTHLYAKLLTRKCRGCPDPSVHTHHLTLLGRWQYIWRYDLRARRKRWVV